MLANNRFRRECVDERLISKRKKMKNVTQTHRGQVSTLPRAMGKYKLLDSFNTLLSGSRTGMRRTSPKPSVDRHGHVWSSMSSSSVSGKVKLEHSLPCSGGTNCDSSWPRSLSPVGVFWYFPSREVQSKQRGTSYPTQIFRIVIVLAIIIENEKKLWKKKDLRGWRSKFLATSQIVVYSMSSDSYFQIVFWPSKNAFF